MPVNRQTNMGQARSKSVVLTALLRNPKTAQIMQSALDSPIGSSYRDQARGMMKSLWRASGNKSVNDGQGGVGGPAPVMATNDSYYPMQQNPYQQPQGSDELTVGMEGEQLEPGMVKMLPAAPTPNPLGGSYIDSSGKMVTAPQSPPAPGGVTSPLTVGMGPEGLGSTVPGKQQQGGYYIDKDGKVVGDSSGIVDLLQPSTPQKTAPAQQSGTQPFVGPEQAPGGYESPGMDTTGVSPESGVDYSSYYETWYGGLSDEEKDKYSTLYNAVSSGAGPAAFAFQMMNDKAALKKMFPNVPEEYLPDGALLSGQLAELQDAMYSEAGLDKMMTNISKLKKRGATLQTDLKDYVKGRDTYIEKLDGMIGKAKDKMGTMDMANPYVNDRMNKYMSYLTILKGRQEKRYIDYVNDSITQHNTELQFAQDEYKTMYDKYKTEFTNSANIQTEEFNYFKGMLGDMYSNLSGQEAAILDKQEKMLDIKYRQSQIIKNIADASDSMGADGIDDITSTEMKFYTTMIEGMGSDDGSYDLKDYYDLTGRATDAGFYAERFKPQYLDKVSSIANKESNNGNFLGFYGDLDNVLYNMMTSGNDNAATDSTELAGKAINSMVNGMDDYLMGDNYNISNVKEVISDLVGWSYRGAEYDDDEKDKFKKKNGGKVSGDMLDFLFDNYINHKDAAPLKEIYDLDKSDQDLSNDILIDYDNYLRGRAMSTINS